MSKLPRHMSPATGYESKVNKISHYHLLEVIGTGAFGVVHRGLNTAPKAKYHTVAIKRVSLLDIPKEELDGLEMEIFVLKELVHKNIVNYVETIRSQRYLNIVLEFVENGSLASIVKNSCGALPESLCTMYIRQTLIGLEYLHNQGVIHRDIKGANILMTKDGIIKLADFGVAAHMGRASMSVAGTPYWMAPEIIEMSGNLTPSCDIWSLGCTTLELLTGSPPYFKLQPLSALFRIVQDEYPPLPSGISPALEDFLIQCFQKDPTFRPTASQLLKHPWLRTDDEGVERAEDFVKTLGDDTKSDALKTSVATVRGPLGGMFGEDLGIINEDDSSGEEGKRSRNNSIGDSSEGTKSDGDESEEDWGFEFDVDNKDDGGVSTVNSGLGFNVISSESMNDLNQFMDNEDDDDFDDLGDVDTTALSKADTIRTISSTGFFKFDVFDRDWDENAAILDEVRNCVDLLSIEESDDTIIECCDSLLKIFNEDPSQINGVLMNHSIIPILEILEHRKSDEPLLALMKCVHMFINVSDRSLPYLCVVGLIPATRGLMERRHSLGVRKEAVRFLQKVCAANSVRDMFVAGGGLGDLVRLIESPYEEKKLVTHGIDCILTVFNGARGLKKDFHRLFHREELFRPLLRCLQRMCADKDWHRSQEYIAKTCDIFLLFAQGGVFVKRVMFDEHIISGFLSILDLPNEDTVLRVMKVIKMLTMDSESIERLEACGAIPRFVAFLGSENIDIQNQAIFALFEMCRIKKSRQEQAAKRGLIPHLKKLIEEKHPLSQFLFPIICRLAHTSLRTLEELRKNECEIFYLDLLEQYYWQIHALEALVVWLRGDRDRVEAIILQPANIEKIAQVFRTTHQETFQNCLSSLCKMVQESPRINFALGSNDDFTQILSDRLLDRSDAIAHKVLLELTRSLFRRLKMEADATLLTKFVEKLNDVLRRMSQQAGNKIIVRNYVSNLLREFATIDTM